MTAEVAARPRTPALDQPASAQTVPAAAMRSAVDGRSVPMQAALTLARWATAPFRSTLRDAKDFASTWHDFWFHPDHPATVALLRWLVGGMAFYTVAVWTISFDEFFRPGGWQSERLVELARPDGWQRSFWWLVPDPLAWTVHGACLAALAAYTVGFLTPVTRVLAPVIVISYANRVPHANFGLDQITGFLALYLALAPCGRVMSVDSWIRKKRGRSLPADKLASPRCRLAVRLIQVQLCVVYTFAGLAKLKGEAWWDGTAIWIALANLEYQSFDMTWIAWHEWFGQFLTHGTMLWELSFWALVWNTRARPYVLAIGTSMHFGIGGVMGMWTFGLIMSIAYFSFTPPDVVRGWLPWFPGRAGEARSGVAPRRGSSARPVHATAHAVAPRTGSPSVVDVGVGSSMNLSAASDGRPRPDICRLDSGLLRTTTKPLDWDAAVAAGPAPSFDFPSLLVVTHRAKEQARVLGYFPSRGFETRTAPDWQTACQVRSRHAINLILLRTGSMTPHRVADIEAQLGNDESLGVVVVDRFDDEPLHWVRYRDEITNGHATLGDLRRSLSRVWDHLRADHAATPEPTTEPAVNVPFDAAGRTTEPRPAAELASDGA